MSNTIRGTTKVFISCDSDDLHLAHRLKDALRKESIDGYLFDSEQQYDSPLHDKITNAINGSQALIAIITNGSSSASVHEEIGYAFAKGKSVIIMLEEGAQDGVLSHEREHEPFTKDSFDNSFSKIIKYVKESISKAITSVESTAFLNKRGLLDDGANNFCMTPNSTNIKNMMMQRKPTAHPVVLFSSCPIKLLDDILINSQQYAEWSKKFSRIPVSGQQVGFLQGDKKIEFEKTTYYYGGTNDFTTYVEIHSNGFVEQGHTQSLMSTRNYESMGMKTMLHSSWTAGTFWAFLIFCREHYQKHGYSDEIDIFLSIRDAHALVLTGFATRWAVPGQAAWFGRAPHTDKHNILIKKRIKASAMSEERIEELTREFVDKIANAYGLESALCYNQDGALDRELLGSFHLR